MDKSKKYIKMCEKAWEIQRRRGKYIETGSFYYQPKYATSHVYPDVNISKNGVQRCLTPNPRTWRIWLPRQDQLQEMVCYTKDACTISVCTARINEFANNCFLKDETIQSMEQLWLAFVMKEKFNKIWTDEDWKESRS